MMTCKYLPLKMFSSLSGWSCGLLITSLHRQKKVSKTLSQSYKFLISSKNNLFIF